MYSGTKPNQQGYGGDRRRTEHKGTVISISVPFHELDLIEEMELKHDGVLFL